MRITNQAAESDLQLNSGLGSKVRSLEVEEKAEK